MSAGPPPDRPPDDLLGMRDLFQEEARTILDRLRLRLPELEGQLPDLRGLGDVVADGVALKGSGALVGLTVVSRAGVLIVRAAELAAERAPDDMAGATGIVGSLRASLGALERLLDACLDSDDAAQEALLGEALGHFTSGDRSILRRAVEGEDAIAWPEAPVEPAGARVGSDALAGLVAALTHLLIAETQLGGIEHEIDALASSLDRSGAEGAPIVREVASTLAARAAPARALARAAAELHRQIRELDATATPLESLVLLHVRDGCYALRADDVESVVPAAAVAPPDAAGRTTLLLGGDPLPALDLGTYLGDAAAAAAPIAAVARVDGARFALLVARAEPPRLMVLRPLDALLANHPLAHAATVGRGGNVVLVLRAAALRDVLYRPIDVRRDPAQPPTRS